MDSEQHTVFPLHFHIAHCAPEHSGLGTGTQLGLAVARLMTSMYECPHMTAPQLAKLVGRGQRSAIGIHGFDHGGFLVEAGKQSGEAIAPLITRFAFPDDWPILLILPRQHQGLHGPAETQAMSDLVQPLPTAQLCQMVLQTILPALSTKDYHTFGEALYEYNRLVGESFRMVQGGVYSHKRSDAIVAFLRREGISAVGQSSWGPALYSIANDAMQASRVAHQVRERFGFAAEEVVLTRAKNDSALVVTSTSDTN